MSVEFVAVSPYNAIARLSLPEKITIYDSTLRDGEQMPGVTFTTDQKLAIAHALDSMGVPQIEAGFPAVSDGERESVRRIAGERLDAEVLCLARTLDSDIDAALACDVDMVLLFIATSELHLRYKLKMSREQVMDNAIRAVDYAKDHGLRVSLSSEDSTRSDVDFLLDMFHAAEEAGAERVGMTDTLGCAGPEAICYLVRRMRESVKVPVSAHLHNDFGLGVANAVAALSAGAEAITTTVGGLGERAGNVPLEQLVMAITHLYKRNIGIRTEGLTDLCRLVFESARIPIPPNQPWVGPNAFSHESGIHVAAVLNCPMTYECLNPEKVGNRRRLVLGKHSGTAIVRSRLHERGLEATPEQMCEIVRVIKIRGESKGRVSDHEFWEIARDVISGAEKG
jgi:isopropylmalate/homocitrate/citramalate synthase